MAETERTRRLREAESRLLELGRYFDLDRKREALRQLEERMAAPGFWNDQESARRSYNRSRS